MVSITLSDKPKTKVQFKYGLELKSVETAKPTANQSVVKIQAAALNHREVWILKGMYPNIVVGSVMGADAVATIVENGTKDLPIGSRVLINPGTGWESDEKGPEHEYRILGLLPCIGTLTDEPVVVDSLELVACPDHLTQAEAAALPLAGLTAYRAVFTKAQVKKGDHVLITGIGGGVALAALQFAVAVGAYVYVTSSSQDKIDRAIKLGAVGGVNYKNEKCINELTKLLGNNLLSAVIDGAGGPLFSAYPRVMKNGGIISSYGQTAAGPGVTFTMIHVLKNIELKGSTMGSREEFRKMVTFVNAYKIKPIVSHIWHELSSDAIDEAITMLSNGNQFGKLVLETNNSSTSPRL